MNIETLIPVLGANLIWQTMLLALVVAITLRILPKHAARARYRIALLALFGSGLLCVAPFMPDLTPDLSIGLSPQAPPVTQAPTAITPPAPVPQYIDAINVKPSPALPLGKIFFVVWLLGSIFSLLRLSFAAFTAHNWAHNARPLSLPVHNALSQPVHIRRSPNVTTPLVLEFFRPVVMVPQDFDLCLENLGTRAVLEHEIAHLTRGDLWTNLAQHLVLALLWWCVPLYWINAQIGIEREKLCDDMAAHKIGTGRVLANALINLADKQSKRQPLLAIGIHPRAHNLAERIHRLCKRKPLCLNFQNDFY